MAYTLIKDVFVPQVLSQQIAAEMDTRTSALIRSGAVIQDSILAAAAGQNRGSKVTIPQYASFTSADKVGNDTDPGANGTTGLLASNARSSFEVDVPMMRRVVNFDAMDLARAEANADPLGDVAAQAAAQIIANQDYIVISALAGVLADNDAAPTAAGEHVADDMITDITSTSATVAAANRFSRSTLIDAVAQWGDYGSQASVIVMHSAVYYQLLKDDTTSFAREGDQGFVGTYMGVPIVLEDRSTVVPAVTSGSTVAAKYVSYVLGAGAIGYASILGSPVYDRNEKAGNGWGGESVIVRRTDLVNPRGISFIDADSNPENSDLADATHWMRRFQRKNVNIVFVRSNVA